MVRNPPGGDTAGLEEQLERTMQGIRERLMEAGIAQQGPGERPGQPCTCGGEWECKGYRERRVMTRHGSVRIRRAYYVCTRCGAGLFPLDEQLQHRKGWSEGLLEQVLWTAQAVTSYREAEEALERLTGVYVSKSSIHRMVEK